jgi:aryl-alcohol dehydrogenase-like predicted oxidoreductase
LPWAPLQNTEPDGPVAQAAKAHGATEHQVVLAWLLARSPQILPIPGTGSAGHAAANVEAAAIELTPAEVEAISGTG